MWGVISILCLCVVCGVVGILVYKKNQKRADGIITGVDTIIEAIKK